MVSNGKEDRGERKREREVFLKVLERCRNGHMLSGDCERVSGHDCV